MISTLKSIEQRPLVACAIIAVVACVAYWPSFDGKFLFDDEYRILLDKNLDPDNSSWTDHLTTRRPLVTTSLAINYAIGKGELREPHDAWSYHFVNLCIHIAAALTLFGLLRRTFSRVERFELRASRVALAAALLWAVHPLTTQAVTYMIQRAESGMALFYLLTLYCFVRGVDAPAKAKLWFTAAVVSTGLGMGCKAVIITVPIVVFAYDRIFVARSYTELLSKRWGLYAGLFVSLFVLSNGVFSGVLSTKAGTTSHVGFQYKGVTPLEYLLSQPAVLVRYLQLSVWPDGLCLDYSWVPAQGFSQWGPQGVVVLLLLGLTIYGLKKAPRFAFLGLVFFTVLAPTSSIVPIKDIIFEHRMYLPLAAVVVALVVGVDALLSRVTGKPAGAERGPAAVALVAIVALSLTVATYKRNQTYGSDIAMWEDVIETSPENGRAYINLGLAVSKSDPSRLAESLEHFEKACFYAPEYVLAWQFRGRALFKLKRHSESLPFLRTALSKERRRPDRFSKKRPAETRFLLGCALAELNRLDEARTELELAVASDGERSLYWENLGAVRGRQKDFAAAQEALLKAVELAPNDPDRPQDFSAITAQLQLAITYANLNEPEKELATLEEAKRREPESLAVRENFLLRSIRVGDRVRALADAKFIQGRAPDHPVLSAPAIKALLESGQ